ncbi:hypothetical protein D3800_00950 [Microcystis aeruginosa NIES-298]|uniref:Uncharacterized protein n=2 Tax=Microcystis aeruginosa TaxID=1126 RepID=A0A2H6BTS8_MICAE|nr:hypothetical protein [Microcystis aeruginosa]QHU82035.1 hypothetical protein D3800_00950 [Microcystis aeruginosa NIES-298]BAP15891.1 predicted membrane protein [Microcystis aeruginosa]BAP15894.1 predicted membrane protein [Microcystis aeruginosa]BAP15897.1 predicted membrane protein [Microcystis aeruginosa]BAP26976.1 predicted membrane protein [Microcystis aeruginosa]
MALLPSSALTFLNIAYFKAPVSPISFNQATYSWVEAVQGWAAAASDPATFNSLTNGNPPTYGYLISPSTGNAEQYVNDVYQNLFGSGPSAANLTYWKNWLAQFGNNIYIGKDGTNYGIASYKALVVAVYEYATADEIAALTNRQTVSQYFSTSMQSNPSGSVPSFNTAQYNAGWASISTVTKDPATVTTAKASIDQYIATTGSVGNSFVLTPDVDIKSGNQFLAPPVAGSAGGVLNTFTSGDQLTGTGTNPTLTILWQQDTAGITTVQPTLLKGISTLNATLVGNNLTVLSTFVTGLKTVNINDTSGNLTMTNLQSALETISISRSFSGSDATFTIADAALAGTEDALAIKLNQVVPAAFPGLNTVLAVSNLSGTGGYEKVSVNSAGFDNTIEMAGVAGLKSLTINGDKALTLAGATSLANTVTLVDASTFNANLIVTNVAPTGNLEFKGGLKVDTFTLSATAGNHTLSGGAGDDNLTIGNNSTVKVSGGDGDDRITFTDGFTKTDVIAGDAGVNTLALISTNAEAITAENANITGIQTLALTTAGTGAATLRADFFGNDVNTVTLQSGTDAAYTVRFNAGNNTLTTLGNTGALNVQAAGTATNDALTLNIGDPATTPAAAPVNLTVASLTLNNPDRPIEQLTIKSNNATAGGSHTITGAVTLPQSAERSETITITGNSTLNIGGLVTADKIDASGLTGNAALVMNGNSAIAISITGSGGDDRLVGSALRDTISGAGGDDNITGGTGTDTLTGGDGRDTFNQTALDSAVASTTNGAAGTAFAAAQTITFAPITGSAVPNVDIIGGFTAGDTGDILNLDSITAAVTGIGVANNALVAGTNYFLSGNFTLGTGVFTITGNGLGSDTLIIQGFAGVGTNIATNTSSIVLLGVNSNNLVGANIV